MGVSVIIPMFNSNNTIVRALESIRKQTIFWVIKEIIVIDDGSSDGSYEKVYEYSLKHVDMPLILIRQKNMGPSVARNVGLELAREEWIAFLDSDDEWVDFKLERQFYFINLHPEIDFLGTNAKGNVLNILFKSITVLYKASVLDLLIKSFPVTPSILMRKKIYEEIGGFDENRKYLEDSDYCIRICSRYNFYHLPEPLVNIGINKTFFGEMGLSSNIRAMYYGGVKNLINSYKRKQISFIILIVLRFFYLLKFIRRRILTIIAIKRKAQKK